MYVNKNMCVFFFFFFLQQKDAKQAVDDCFLLNTRLSSRWANCGKDERNEYIPCATK